MKKVKNISFIFIIALGILAIHFFNITMIKHRELSTLASNQRSKKENVKNWRGGIYDCNMIPLCDRDETLTKIQNGKSVSVTGRYGKTSVAKHIIGYTDSSGAGVCGIEKIYDDILKTDKTSTVSYVSDIKGNAIETANFINDRQYSPDSNIRLTLDYKIQKIAEQAADEYLPSGAIVILDTQNFDIKAIVSRPDFDQNNIKEYIGKNDGSLLNKALCSYNAGSIFKIITSAAAIEKGVNINHYCNGILNVDGLDFACHFTTGHKNMDFKNAFAKSCNCYFYALSQKIGGNEIIDAAKKFGLSQQILDIPLNEDGGFLPKKLQFSKRDSANVAIGQGEILITPIQAAYITCVIANKGIGKTVNLSDSIVDANGNTVTVLRKDSNNTVISKECAKVIGDMMRECVLEGTAQNVQNGIVAVAGKTGSAETGWLDEWGSTMVHGWFCGYFPYENPKYAMAVFSENGKSGSSSCIPAFKKIVLDINNLYNITKPPEQNNKCP